ncbi:MAG: sigma-70 family RNA polymerase sigma factor [Planctomycetota bacterium]
MTSHPSPFASHPIDDISALHRYRRRGDPDAFEMIVLRYRGMVFATCLRALGDAAQADDATQETFLKLAQQAGRVRSNVAAWLHRCAIGTSIDLVRRADARRRAERNAASVATPGDNAPAWADLEPVIDRALASLSDADRDLIIARYLAGRSQRDLAREAGVSEGTLSRRLTRAVERLRGRLGEAGLAVAGTAVLVGVLEAAPIVTVPPDLVASLAKIGLSGVGRAAPAGRLAMLCTLGAAAAVLGAVLITPALLGNTGSNAAITAASTVQTADLGPEPPRGKIGPFEIVSASDEDFQQRGIWIGERTISVRYGYTAKVWGYETDGVPRRATLDIRELTPLQDDPTTRGREEVALIEARVAALSPVGDEYSRFELGQRLEIDVWRDDSGRLVLAERDNRVQLGRNEPRWHGVRPPAGWPEFGRIPGDPGPLGLLGPWTEAERIPVTITAAEIYFGGENWVFARYRVIEWDRRDGYSRVLSINAGGRDPRLIGTRFPLLLRREGDAYEVAYFPMTSPRAGDWPGSFAYSKDNPVRVVRFEGDE